MVDIGIRVEGLVGLVGDYFDEADGSLQAAYGRDLIAEFLRDEITLHQLRVLIECLPLDSAYVRALRGNSWSDLEWLLHDVSSQLRWRRVEAASVAAERRLPDPKLLPTPLDGIEVASVAEEEYREQQTAEFSAFAAALDPENDEN